MLNRLRPGLLALILLGACEPAPEPEPEPEPGPEWALGLERGKEFGALLSVWGPSPTEVYAVGGNPEAGAMVRFDGEAWSDQAIPAGFPLVNWVYGVPSGGGTALWVAGNGGVVARRDPQGAWTQMDLGTDSALWGIWGLADDDMWTVGGNIPGTEPILAHWDGQAWTRATIPALDREFDALLKVWGTGPNQVFAIGHRGVVLRYDGQAWTQELAGTTADLVSLWGTGPSEIVAVGGRANGVIARYDGQAWTSETIGLLPGLNGVWMAQDGVAFVVGTDGVALELAAGSFDWTLVDRSVRPDILHGAFGLSNGSRFGVGGNLQFSPPWTGVIVQLVHP
jgi:hypothetical protein